MSQHSLQGNFEIFDASSYRVGIVVAMFNADVSAQLLKSAQDMCALYGIKPENITVHEVPGSVEIPFVLSTLAKSNKSFDALVALGTIIEGETPHFEYVCKIVSEGVLRVTLDENIPIGFGILTCKNHAQALERIDTGGTAVRAVLNSVKIAQEYDIQNTTN